MTVNIEVDDELLRQIDLAAAEGGTTRSALIQQALREWLCEKRAGWPAEVMVFQGLSEAPRFESKREELKLPEPFDGLST